jgi:hypothetical protein
MKIELLPSIIRRTTVSAFIVLNLGTVLFVNLPSTWLNSATAALRAETSPFLAYRLEWCGWGLRRYAYWTGLNARWQMFGRQSKFNWHYTIHGCYSDGVREERVLLDIPRQSHRDFLDRFVDFKELKIELNIYNNRPAREAYSRYLARQFPLNHNLPIRSVRWDLNYQMILPPDEAMSQQRMVDPRTSSRLLDEFAVSGSKGER